MKPASQLARLRVTSDRLDLCIGRVACFAAAALLFPLAVLKLCSLGLPQGQLVIGLLAALACTLLMIVLGLLLPLTAAAPLRRDHPGRR